MGLKLTKLSFASGPTIAEGENITFELRHPWVIDIFDLSEFQPLAL